MSNYFEQKKDQGKLRYTLLPWDAITAVVKILEFGAKKYSEGGWRTVPDGERRYRDACLRHLVALLDGEDDDPESGEPHEAHLATNALFLLAFRLRRVRRAESLDALGLDGHMTVSSACLSGNPLPENPEKPVYYAADTALGGANRPRVYLRKAPAPGDVPVRLVGSEEPAFHKDGVTVLRYVVERVR